uniref:Neurensin-1 n=1 Tax=Clastoptera arizonana TaxID=38151 RepID=A0A1B6CUV6_9HEMI
MKQDKLTIGPDSQSEIKNLPNWNLSTKQTFNGGIGDKLKSYYSIQSTSHQIQFGIKSYLHNFYDPPDQEVMNSGEFSQDDFQTETNARNHRGCCIRCFLWLGINLTIIGLATMLFGFLIPTRNAIVGHQDNLEILDRSAITFNHYLELSQILGLAIVCFGTTFLTIMLYISKKYNKKEPNYYYVLGATIIPETFVANPNISSQTHLNSILYVNNILSLRKK